MSDEGQSLDRGFAGVDAEAMAEVYDELRRLAAAWFRRQPSDHTLQPTALVHEAYVKLASHEGTGWKDRPHFFAVAARAMRQILVDHARRRGAVKRGGGRRQVTLTDSAGAPGTSGLEPVDILALDDALTALAELNERQARIVEMRFLAGLTIDDAAAALGVSSETVKLDWRMARAWLQARLG